MNFKPLFDNVVIELDKEPTVSKGGIALPKIVRNFTTPAAYGTVVAVGDGVWTRPAKTFEVEGSTGVRHEDLPRYPLSVSVGDRVMFLTGFGTEFEAEEKKMIVIREDNILGIVT